MDPDRRMVHSRCVHFRGQSDCAPTAACPNQGPGRNQSCDDTPAQRARALWQGHHPAHFESLV